MKGTRARDTRAANTRGGQRICRKERPEDRRAKISLSSESRPNVRRQANRSDMGTLRLRIVGRNRKKIFAERTTDTPLFTSKSIKSKILSKRRTPEKSANPKKKGGRN